MNAIDALGTIGEVLSWFGLGLGLPALLIALLVRAGDGRWLPVEVVLVPEGTRIRARWYAADDFRERLLTADETARWRGRETVDAFISEHHPHRMRAEPRRPLLHAIYVAGLALTAVGAASVLLSLLPLVVA
ncbi:hypothetical protein [Leucobacter triazinivorans]|uniref:Uncharacterized protein n=1 Tax=Leucobacter triazinivorans TaxID=1784719 RepID=A0A4P6KEQ4_9MICO|nr:hypothetical protein [Leucobacter triazinivorans]QBE48418.1 hypothetical protein EVS81_05825 [Leucobacter triazinivorans]